MGVVHHHDRAVLFRQLAQRRERPEIAVHAEDAVGDEQLALARHQIAQDVSGRVDVLMRKHLDRGAAQAAAVDDAGVIELVTDHRVLVGEQCFEQTAIGVKA